MAWAVTLRVTDCATGSNLPGAFITDGMVTYYTDAYGQFIAIIDDAFHTYIVNIGKSGYTTKSFSIHNSMVGTIQTICLDEYISPPNCCFTGDTLVTLADGAEKPIALVREGDLVLGRSGQPNRVIGIKRPLIGDRRLFALNGGAPFVTAEHPFLTETGWKAINPKATAAENARLMVGRLAVKDVVLKLQGCAVPVGALGYGDSVEPILEPTSLVSLEARHTDPGTILYNLLLDGDHAYFANGFLVHNKNGW